MALKTTIGPNGVITETIAGTQDQLVVDVEKTTTTINTVVSASGLVDLSLGVTTMLVAPSAAGVTCSLPELNVSSEGQHVVLLLDLNGERVMVSGSAANPIDGNATFPISGAYGVLDLMGVKADDDGNFHWHILEQKQ